MAANTTKLARANGVGLAYQEVGQGILPGATHCDINMLPALSAAISPFLDAA